MQRKETEPINLNKKRSLVRYITIVIVISVTLVTVTSMVINIYIVNRENEQLFEKKSLEYLSFLKKSLEIPLWNFDTAATQKLSKMMMSNDIVASLTIKENNNNTLLFSERKDEVIENEVRKANIEYNNTIIGSLELGLTKRYYQKEQNRIFYNGLFTILGVIVIIYAVVIFSIRRFLRKPLTDFSERIDAISEGNYQHSGSTTSYTELQGIMDRFNQMAILVQKRENSLVETNEVLRTEISEREKAQEALRESEKKYRNLFENLYDVYYRTDDKGLITLISPSAQKYFGYTPDEIMGQNMENAYVDMKRREEFLWHIHKNGYVNNFEARLRRKDNSVIWVSTNAILLRDEEGNFIGIEGITRDITERKELENKLIQAQKMESIGTLAGGIAHDFNNILSPIIAHSEMMMYDLPPDSRLLQNISEILKAAERAKNLVRQILTFSRQKDQEITPIQISLVLKEALKLLRASIPATIEIKTNINTEYDTVLADPTQVHQIFINLCTNASQAMGEKRGILEVSLSTEHFESTAIRGGHKLKPGAYVKIEVSDTGPGIKPEDVERIFDPYFTTKDIEKGTGLGLAVVHGIVKSYNGEITVESDPGKNTVFHIWLPMVRMKMPDEIKKSIEVPKGTENILLVDDEKEIVDSIQLMLEKLGYRVTTRTNSIEALEAFRANSHKFDLVITDMTMPNMTGKELAEKMLNINPEISVVLCTGFSTQINESIAKEIGIGALIMKPVVMSDMATRIRNVLDKK